MRTCARKSRRRIAKCDGAAACVVAGDMTTIADDLNGQECGVHLPKPPSVLHVRGSNNPYSNQAHRRESEHLCMREDMATEALLCLAAVPCRCEICGLPGRMPYRHGCCFCGRRPSMHHGRCCPLNPGHHAWCACRLCYQQSGYVTGATGR